MEHRRGSMWWADVPYDPMNPHAQSGRRPVVIVALLSTKEDKYKFIHPRVFGQDNRICWVLCEQTRVIDKSCLLDYIKDVREVELKYIDKALSVSLGLDHLYKKIEHLSDLLLEANSKLAEAESELAELKSKPAVDETSLALGELMKSALDVYMRSMSEDTEIEVVDDSNVEDNSAASEQVELNDEKLPVHLSQIEKFNARLQKHEELIANDNRCKSNTEEADKLSRPKARKWTDEKITSFVEDYTKLPYNSLKVKYGFRNESTAYKYYRKFSQHKTL